MNVEVIIHATEKELLKIPGLANRTFIQLSRDTKVLEEHVSTLVRMKMRLESWHVPPLMDEALLLCFAGDEPFLGKEININ